MGGALADRSHTHQILFPPVCVQAGEGAMLAEIASTPCDNTSTLRLSVVRVSVCVWALSMTQLSLATEDHASRYSWSAAN